MSILCWAHRQGQFPRCATQTIHRQASVVIWYRRIRRTFSSGHAANVNHRLRLLSLKSEHFLQKKQEVLDLSGQINPNVSIETTGNSQSLSIPFSLNSKAGRELCDPFPKRTRGFFYWFSDTHLHPMTDTIRFRLCDSINGFEKGTDLRTAAGVPWALPLWRVAAHDHWDGLRRLIRDEELVPPGFVENTQVLSALNAEKMPNPLFTINQSIILDVSRWAHSIHLVTGRNMEVFNISHLFRDKAIKTQPYSGHVAVRFEISDSHRNPQLRMRILYHVTPVTVRKSDYNGRIHPLTPGSFLSKWNKSHKKLSPWTYALNMRRHGEIWKHFIEHSPP